MYTFCNVYTRLKGFINKWINVQVHIQAAALISGVGGCYVRLAHCSVGKPELGVHADCHYTERLPRGTLSALRPPPRLPQHAAHAGTSANPLKFTILHQRTYRKRMWILPLALDNNCKAASLNFSFLVLGTLNPQIYRNDVFGVFT